MTHEAHDAHAQDHAHEAVEHLQNAATEMIRATRAFLDLAEELIADPTPLLGVADLIANLAGKGRAAANHEGQTARPESGVQHIRVS